MPDVHVVRILNRHTRGDAHCLVRQAPVNRVQNRGTMALLRVVMLTETKKAKTASISGGRGPRTGQIHRETMQATCSSSWQWIIARRPTAK